MKKTAVGFLLDETGSMEIRKGQAISAFNGLVDALRNDGNKYSFTLAKFNLAGMTFVCDGVSMKKVKPLTDETYQPNNATPLIDACYRMIGRLEETVKPGQKVVCIFQTDGEENSSSVYTKEQLQARIKEKEAAGWQFVFLGVDIDAYGQSSQFGMQPAASVRVPTGAMAAAYGMTARKVTSYGRGDSAGVSFTQEEQEDLLD